jgi:thymidylate kinase
MKIGKLIVFEGADEVGKTTLATLLAESLRSKGVPCESIGFPGNKIGTLGQHVNELHHEPARFHVAHIDPTSLQFLHIAAHIDAIEQQILPALKKNRAVILDRFWWSSWVYGTVNLANKNSLKAAIRAEAIHWNGIQPSRIFLVTRSAPLEAQTDIVKWKQIDRLYKKFADEQKRKCPITLIKNESSPNVALEQVQKCLEKLWDVE